MLDPSLVFITTDRWEIEQFRDDYLERMIKTFQEIDNSHDNKLKLVWSYKLEEILWSTSKYKPWNELNGGNSLVPILYKYFRRNIDFLNHKDIESTSTPKLEIDDVDISTEYYKLTNELIVNYNNFAFFSDTSEIEFTSNCGINYIPSNCNNCFGICKLNLTNNLFSVEDLETKKKNFSNVINLYITTNNFNLKNDFSFSNSFIRKVASLSSEDLNELIEKLSLRLKYNSGEARACNIIQDEFITANSINEHRIRITHRPTSKRVHYIFNDGKIEFKSYYGIGEHDEGL